MELLGILLLAASKYSFLKSHEGEESYQSKVENETDIKSQKISTTEQHDGLNFSIIV